MCNLHAVCSEAMPTAGELSLTVMKSPWGLGLLQAGSRVTKGRDWAALTYVDLQRGRADHVVLDAWVHRYADTGVWELALQRKMVEMK